MTEKTIQLERWKKIASRSAWVVILLALLISSCAPVSGSTPKAEKPTSTQRPARLTPGAFTPRPMFITTPTATPASNIELEAGDLKAVKITFWHPWAGESGKEISKLVNEFNLSNPWGIVVQANAIGGYDELFEAVSAALDAGAGPDVVAGYYYQGLGWDNAGHELLALDPYLDDPVWGFSPAEQADFYPGAWLQELRENGRYGIPAQRTAQLLYYNHTWAKELGFASAPATAAQFERQACAAAQAYLKDADRANDGQGGLILSTDYNAVLSWVLAFNGQVTNPKGDRYLFNTPEVKAAFEFLRELFDQGCAWISPQEIPDLEFASRKGLFSIGGSAGIPSQEGIFADLGSKDEWIVIPYPAGPGKTPLAIYGPSFMAFETRPRAQLASWLLIKWLVAPASQARLAQASAQFPVRESSLELMGLLPKTYPQWSTAASFLPSASPEPPFASWGIVRLAVSDAATQLFRYYFVVEQVPQLIDLLEETANDLHDSFR